MKAYLSLGSNIHPAQNLLACLKKIRKTFLLQKVSSIYETSPVGLVGPRPFWNLALQIETSLARNQLQRKLRRIERELGRVRGKNKFLSRPIDIDLIAYRNWRRVGFEKFAFILFPLAQIAPRLKGVHRKSLHQIAQGFCDPKQKIRKIRKPFL